MWVRETLCGMNPAASGRMNYIVNCRKLMVSTIRMDNKERGGTMSHYDSSPADALSCQRFTSNE